MVNPSRDLLSRKCFARVAAVNDGGHRHVLDASSDAEEQHKNKSLDGTHEYHPVTVQ